MSDELEGVKVKFRRADRHLQELRAAIEAFRATEPYVIDTRRDPETRRLIYYLSKVSSVPAEVSVIAGEVLQGLRSALDYIAYQLVVAGTGQRGPFTHVYFPIFDSETAYNTRKARYVQGMRQDAIGAIDALRPYKDGNDTLWKLHKLNIIDKHRLLVTVGAQVRSFDVGSFMTSQMQLPDATPVPPLEAFFKVADPMFPLKVGDELMIDVPDAKPSEHFRVRFEIVLHEPPIVEGERIDEVLGKTMEEVARIGPIFEAFF